MSATINTGWLKGKNGVKFAPKTLSSQVITNDGIALEEKIAADLNEIKTYIDETVSGNEGGGPHDHNDTYYTESEIDSMLSTTASTIKDDLLNGAGEAYDTLRELGELIDENTDAIEALEIIATNKMDKNNPVGTGSFSLNRKTGSNVGLYSFAEGSQNIASSYAAHAEGSETAAYSYAAHAEGWKTTANGDYSHAEGEGTIAAGRGQTAMGCWNVSDTSSKLLVGIGTDDTDRKNGFKVSSTGQGYFASEVYANDSKKLATEEFVTASIENKQDKITDTLILADTITGEKYKIQIQNGQLVTSLIEEEA
jgi:hypothetical protein